MTDIAEQLDRMIPPYAGAGDWSRVVADSGVTAPPLRLPVRLAFATALVAVIAATVAFWPSGGSSPTLIDRALAAAGSGSVLHIVYESDQQHALVDLETGQRTEIRAQHEVWFEPGKILRERETFDGVVQSDGVFQGGRIPEHATEVYASLGAGYREALESGDAKVVREGDFEGTPVYWIQIAEGHEVAVSKETYKPVTIQISLGEMPLLNRILTYETLEPGSAPLDGAQSGRPGLTNVGPNLGEPVDLADAPSILGREAVWAGADLHGFPLDSTQKLAFPSTGGPVSALSVKYGTPEMPHVEIIESATATEGQTMLVGVHNYLPKEGTALVTGSTALLRSNGLVVTIVAHDEEMAILVARALEPYSG
jgi:hypothetical protein